MDFTALTTMSSEDLASALALDFSTMDDAALAASLAERRDHATTLFALEAPSIAQADVAEALVASIGEIEAKQAERAAEVTAAAERFAAARAKFSSTGTEPEEGEDGSEDTDEDGDGDDADAEDGDDADAEDGDGDGEGEGDGEGDGGEAAVTAAAQRGRKITAARKVGARTKRPAKESTPGVVITASADVPGFGTGARMEGMTQVAAAVMGRTKGFAPYSARAAQALRNQGVHEQLVHAPVAQFAVASTNNLTAKSGTAAEYDAVGEAVKAHIARVNASLGFEGEAALAAAMAWCSPSEVVYNWIADFVVDGLLDLPEISAPRGGLMLTEGPRLAQEGYGTEEDFGFGGTEAEMEAGYIKTCETIECPDFFDHRLDFDGYCWKIPILTQKTFPELVADALRTSDLLYAHKMNKRFINDILAESTARDASSIYGGSVMDTIEALVQIATKERRWWNIGENAILEVKLPQFARDVFKIDMQRRSGLALSDVATDQKINALFATYRLSVKYLSDFDEITTSTHPTADWGRNDIRAIIYPAGTFVKAQDDVITLSAVHDAASLSKNEYTGVFYEQGVKTIRRGYRSTVVSVPICTAGATGSNSFVCDDFGSY